MNLYQATALAQLQNFVDEDGSIDIDSFNRSQIALADKQRAVVAYLKNESVNIDMLDDAIKQLTARKKAMQSHHDALKGYLLVNMQANDISEITAQDFTFSAKIKLNPHKLIIDDASKIPNEYFIQPETPPPVPDNALIKDKLKAGEVVEGCHLEQGQRVEIK